jgi:hypothetical protein
VPWWKEYSYIVAARAVFFRKVHESRQSGTYCVYCLDQAEPCQKELLEDEWWFSGLRVPISNGGHIICCAVCLDGIHSRHQINFWHYHDIKNWFEEQFLPYLKNVIFWNVIPCSLVDGYQHFEEMYCCLWRWEVVWSSKALVNYMAVRTSDVVSCTSIMELLKWTVSASTLLFCTIRVLTNVRNCDVLSWLRSGSIVPRAASLYPSRTYMDTSEVIYCRQDKYF